MRCFPKCHPPSVLLHSQGTLDPVRTHKSHVNPTERSMALGPSPDPPESPSQQLASGKGPPTLRQRGPDRPGVSGHPSCKSTGPARSMDRPSVLLPARGRRVKTVRRVLSPQCPDWGLDRKDPLGDLVLKVLSLVPSRRHKQGTGEGASPSMPTQ